jgi:hypothetical protein
VIPQQDSLFKHLKIQVISLLIQIGLIRKKLLRIAEQLQMKRRRKEKKKMKKKKKSQKKRKKLVLSVKILTYFLWHS